MALLLSQKINRLLALSGIPQSDYAFVRRKLEGTPLADLDEMLASAEKRQRQIEEWRATRGPAVSPERARELLLEH